MSTQPPTAPRRLDRTGRLAALALGIAALSAAAQAHKAHQHGHARLEVTVEPTALTLRVEAALDGFVGFERAPRNDGERQRVREAEARLRDGAALFAVDPAAGCSFRGVTLVAPVLGWAAPAAAAATAPAVKAAGSEEHADLEAEYRFDCRDGARAAFVNVGLYAAFPRLRRIEAEAVTPRGQMKQELRRPDTRLTLAR